MLSALHTSLLVSMNEVYIIILLLSMKLRLSVASHVTQLPDKGRISINGSNQDPRDHAFYHYANPNSQRILSLRLQ